MDFELIVDLVGPFDHAQGFLGHLLLEEGADRTPKDEPAVVGFEPHEARGDMRIGIERGLSAINEGGVDHGVVGVRLKRRDRAASKPIARPVTDSPGILFVGRRISLARNFY
jgi:hypothetical protein